MIWKSDGPAAGGRTPPLTCISLTIRKCQSKRRGRDSPPRLGEISWGRLPILQTSRVIVRAWRVKKGAERGGETFLENPSYVIGFSHQTAARSEQRTDGRANERPNG